MTCKVLTDKYIPGFGGHFSAPLSFFVPGNRSAPFFFFPPLVLFLPSSFCRRPPPLRRLPHRPASAPRLLRSCLSPSVSSHRDHREGTTNRRDSAEVTPAASPLDLTLRGWKSARRLSGRVAFARRGSGRHACRGRPKRGPRSSGRRNRVPPARQTPDPRAGTFAHSFRPQRAPDGADDSLGPGTSSARPESAGAAR